MLRFCILPRCLRAGRQAGKAPPYPSPQSPAGPFSPRDAKDKAPVWGLNRTLPANVPKFDQPHPETGVRSGMREFESSHSSQPVPWPEVPSLKEQKSPLLAGLCDSVPVSKLPNSRTGRPIRQKSLVTTVNIPIFRRLARELGFDHDCRLTEAWAGFKGHLTSS